MAITLEPAAPLDGDVLLPLDDAKAYLRVEGGDEDALIGALRDAAIDWVERHTGRALVRRAFVWTASRFATPLRLTIEPIVSVDGVGYRGSDGVSVSLDAAGWRLAGRELYAGVGASWPLALAGEGAVRVTLTAGYEDGGVPPALVSAVKLMLGHLYRNRETAVTDAPMAAEVLCAAYRVPVIG